MLPNAWNTTLKTVYLPLIQEQLHLSTVHLAQLEKTDEHLEGDIIEKKIHIGGNKSQGSRRPDSGRPLPTRGGKQKYEKFNIALTTHYGNITIPRQVLAYTPGQESRVNNILADEMEGLFIDMRNSGNKQIHRDGSGILGQLESKASSDTFVVTMRNQIPVSHFEQEMYVDIIEINTATGKAVPQTVGGVKYHYQAAVKVLGVNEGAATIQFNISFATNASDRAFYAAVVDNTFIDDNNELVSSEINGFGAIISDSDPQYIGTIGLQNLPVSRFPGWKCKKHRCAEVAGHRIINIFELMSLCQIAYKGMTVGKNCFLSTSEGVKNALLQVLSESNRTVNTRELTGGYKCSSFETGNGEASILTDDDAPRKKIRIWSNDRIKLGTPNSKLIDFIYEGSNQDPLIHLQAIGQDTYTATAYIDWQMWTDQRNATADYYDIEELWVQ